MQRKRKKRYNNIYKFYEDYIEIYDKNNNLLCFIDSDDYDKIKDIYWNLKGRYVRGYANKTLITLHDFIMNHKYDNKTVVDHIDGNRKNCRKNNLRICTQQQNAFNSKISKNNTTGIIGVYWRKDTNVWTSKLMFNRKNINLGSFDNLDDAIVARLRAEKEYFGEFAPQRDLFEKYGI